MIGGLVGATVGSGALCAAGMPGEALQNLISLGFDANGFHEAVTRRVVTTRTSGTPAEKLARWGTRYPKARSALLTNLADDVDGRLTLPGTDSKPRFAGSPPRWLEAGLGADYLWELNRMYHWPRLLRGWALTGDDRYAERLVAELDDWLTVCPAPSVDSPLDSFTAVQPWRLLEVGIRMVTGWAGVLDFLAGTRFLPADRLVRFAMAVHRHGVLLEAVAGRLWPKADSNHYLMEMTGLIAVAVMFPEFAESERWAREGLAGVERCTTAQLDFDGGQVEGSPHYHNVCVRTFGQAAEYVRRAGLAVSPPFRRQLAKALTYTAFSTRPTGRTVPWADGDATYNAAEAALWGLMAWADDRALSTIQNIVPPDRQAAAAAEIYFWAQDPTRWLTLLDRRSPANAATAHLDRGLDQAMFRTGWGADAASVFFGCHAPVRNGHAHADPGSFDYTALGRTLIADPGRYTYRDGADRKAFKLASYHSGLTIDGREPFEYLGPWDWGPQRDARIVRFQDGDDLRAAEAINRNFAPASHRRLVAMLPDGALLVVDEVVGLPEGRSAQIWFHVDSTSASWREEEGMLITADAGLANLQLCSSGGGSASLLPGRVSDLIDVVRPSTRLRLEIASSGGPLRHAAYLAAIRGAMPPVAVTLSRSGEDVRVHLTRAGCTESIAWHRSGDRILSPLPGSIRS